MEEECYNASQVRNVRIVYSIAAIIWVAICIWLRMFTVGVIGTILCIVPLALFTVAFINAPKLTSSVEQHLFKVNFLSLGLVVMIPLFGMLSKNYKGNKLRFLYIILLAIVCAMFSLVDIWLTPGTIQIHKHMKSIFQIYAIFLMVYAIWLYARYAKRSML